MEKAFLFIGSVAAATLAGNVAAGFEPGDFVVLSRTQTNIALPVRTSYDAARSWNSLVTDTGQVNLAGLRYFNVQGGGTLGMFSVELLGTFPGSRAGYDVTDLSGVPGNNPPGNLTAARQTLLNDLYSRWYDQTMDTDLPSDVQYDYATAFQLVIWEISHENISTDATTALGQLDITRGAMAVTDPNSTKVLNLANGMMQSLGAGGFVENGQLVGLSNPYYQDLLDYTPVVVPGPAVVGLAGLGLFGTRRRRR